MSAPRNWSGWPSAGKRTKGITCRCLLIGAEAQRIVDIFKPILENEAIGKVAQNAKYDVIVLRNYGVEVKGPLFDTMVAHYLLKPELRHGMDYLARPSWATGR